MSYIYSIRNVYNMYMVYFIMMLFINIVIILNISPIYAIRLGQKNNVHNKGNIRSTTNKDLPRYPPDLVAQLRKINQTQAKARQAIANEETIFQDSKKKAKEIKAELKTQIIKLKKQQKWILSIKAKVEKLDEKKKALKLKYDLDRIKPILKQAKEKQKELSSQQQKWKSSSTAIKDKVQEIESQLSSLSGGGGDGDDNNNNEEEKKKSSSSTKNSEQKSNEKDNKVVGAANDTKKDNDKKKKLGVDLDGLLDELDASNK